jgi:transcriptional regulator
MSDAPADYLASMLKAIVGFCLPIDRLEGKWKLSQNRTPEDRAGVVKGLETDGETALAKAVII